MTIGAFITITNPIARGDLYLQCLSQAEKLFDKVTVIDGDSTWPKEFSWELIGQHFQKGYVRTNTDWVFHLDCDFFFHEDDFDRIREACQTYNNQAGLSFWKYQFILPHCYNLKSRLVLAVNKAYFGDRIKFDSGGDLCQPSLDGKEIKPDDVPEARVPIYNYEKIIKTKEQITDDVGRMARAWQRKFGEYKLGGPDDESANDEWYKMVSGRYGKPQEEISLDKHPLIMREVILNLKQTQFGYNGFGMEQEHVSSIVDC